MTQKDQNLIRYCSRNGRGTISRLFNEFRKQKKISFVQFSYWCNGKCETKNTENLAILSSITGIPQDKLFEDAK